MKTQTQRIQLYSLLAILAALLGATAYGLFEIRNYQAAELAAICDAARASVENATFLGIHKDIGAKAYFVYDFTAGKPIHGENADTALPLASLTKLMTIRLALKEHAASYPYVVTAQDLTTEGSIGFVPGDSYALSELSKAALVASSNNAAVMLAHSTGRSTDTFLANMTAEARTLDLRSLSFKSVTGLDAKDDTEATAFGSAEDILKLLGFEYAEHRDILAMSVHSAETVRSVDGKTIEVTNTDKALAKMPLLVASKTGYTDVAGGNLAVLWRDASGRLLGASVLGSSEQGRFADMVRLYRMTDVYLSSMASLRTLCE